VETVDFLNDDAIRRAIVRLTSEAARLWAPDEADLVDVVADEYFRQVQDAGRILYPAKTGDRPLGLESTELWILVILPVVTGFVGNLLSEVGVETFKVLRSKIAQRQRSKEEETKLEPEGIRPVIEREAQAIGFDSKQVEQLVQLLSKVISDPLANGGHLKRNAEKYS